MNAEQWEAFARTMAQRYFPSDTVVDIQPALADSTDGPTWTITYRHHHETRGPLLITCILNGKTGLHETACEPFCDSCGGACVLTRLGLRF